MSELLPIANLTVRDVLAEIRLALTDGVDATHVADFLARIDWSGDEPGPELMNLLGTVEGIASQYADGDLSEDEYRAALGELFVSPTEANGGFESIDIGRVVFNGSESLAEFADTPRRMVTA